MNKVVTQTQLSKKDYIRVCFIFKYSKVWPYIALAIGIIFILLGLLFLIFSSVIDGLQIMAAGLFVAFFSNIILYFKAASYYNSNKKLQESITCTFDEQNFTITGESFSATSAISNIYKVTTTGDWLFVWPSKGMANIISRKSLSNTDILVLMNIFAKNGVKHKL